MEIWCIAINLSQRRTVFELPSWVNSGNVLMLRRKKLLLICRLEYCECLQLTMLRGVATSCLGGKNFPAMLPLPEIPHILARERPPTFQKIFPFTFLIALMDVFSFGDAVEIRTLRGETERLRSRINSIFLPDVGFSLSDEIFSHATIGSVLRF